MDSYACIFLRSLLFCLNASLCEANGEGCSEVRQLVLTSFRNKPWGGK